MNHRCTTADTCTNDNKAVDFLGNLALMLLDGERHRRYGGNSTNTIFALQFQRNTRINSYLYMSVSTEENRVAWESWMTRSLFYNIMIL